MAVCTLHLESLVQSSELINLEHRIQLQLGWQQFRLPIHFLDGQCPPPDGRAVLRIERRDQCTQSMSSKKLPTINILLLYVLH